LPEKKIDEKDLMIANYIAIKLGSSMGGLNFESKEGYGTKVWFLVENKNDDELEKIE